VRFQRWLFRTLCQQGRRRANQGTNIKNTTGKW
jgi:hypothetical protein